MLHHNVLKFAVSILSLVVLSACGASNALPLDGSTDTGTADAVTSDVVGADVMTDSAVSDSAASDALATDTAVDVAAPNDERASAQAVNSCGDAHLDTNESCDDGNVIDGDGCNAQCKKEIGENCLEHEECATLVCDQETYVCSA